MKSLRETYTNKEIVNMYNPTKIVNMFIADDFYKIDFIDMMNKTIMEMDTEDQNFFGDLYNESIKIRAFRDGVTDSEIVEILLEDGWGNDLVGLIEKDRWGI